MNWYLAGIGTSEPSEAKICVAFSELTVVLDRSVVQSVAVASTRTSVTAVTVVMTIPLSPVAMVTSSASGPLAPRKILAGGVATTKTPLPFERAPSAQTPDLQRLHGQTSSSLRSIGNHQCTTMRTSCRSVGIAMAN